MEPASIRFKNPGAMWGRTGKRPSLDKEVPTNNPIALRWGSTTTVYLNDGLNQGNNIAVFPTWVQGICAQIDLWRTPRYHNKRFADAIAVWSGGNYVASYIAYVKARVPGMNENTIMSDAFFNSPSGIAFLKAQSGHEAGKPIPVAESDWLEAQRRVFKLPLPKIANNPQPVKAAAAATASVVVTTIGTAKVAAASGTNWGLIAACVAIGVAAVAFAVWWFHFRHEDQ